MNLRAAVSADKIILEELINEAYRVSDFFKYEKRINQEKLDACFTSGELIIAEDEYGITGCIHLKIEAPAASFGLLSVHPSKQKMGIGYLLIKEVESRAKKAGCNYMDIQIVNLREELFSFYTKINYLQIGTEPFYTRSKLPCYFINMRKSLITV